LIAAVTRELTGKGFAVCFPAWETTVTIDQAASLEGPEALGRVAGRKDFYTFMRWRSPPERATPQEKSDVQLLAKLAAVDTMAFVQLRGYTNTPAQQGKVGGRNTMRFIFGVASGAAGMPSGGNFEPLAGMIGVQLMLVEGATGEPLWGNCATSTDEHPMVDQLVKQLLEPLPHAIPPTREGFQKEQREGVSPPF